MEEIIDDGEKVDKTVRKVSDVYKVGQMVGSVPADRRRIVTEALPTSQKLKNSADWSGDFNLVVNLANISLTLFKTTKFRPFQTERVCRRHLYNGWKWQKVIQTGRKHCGKRGNCLLRAISPSSTLFSKVFYCRHVKTKACLGKA